jgi:hypothetical protein
VSVDFDRIAYDSWKNGVAMYKTKQNTQIFLRKKNWICLFNFKKVTVYLKFLEFVSIENQKYILQSMKNTWQRSMHRRCLSWKACDISVLVFRKKKPGNWSNTNIGEQEPGAETDETMQMEEGQVHTTTVLDEQSLQQLMDSGTVSEDRYCIWIKS